MDLCVQAENGNMDKEWIILIQTAQKMGISIEEVKFFLATYNTQENKHQELLENPEGILTNA